MKLKIELKSGPTVYKKVVHIAIGNTLLGVMNDEGHLLFDEPLSDINLITLDDEVVYEDGEHRTERINRISESTEDIYTQMSKSLQATLKMMREDVEKD